ncbi:MAG: hypothetical protein HFF09_05100 [Oscillospiraceae bacterium]|nr:hypothetical protein [Oscillospiraceae bacterium]
MVKNRKAHITEWLKNVLIVLLALSAIFLGWRTHLFDDLLSGVRTPELPTMSGGAAQDYTEFVRPVNVAVVNENGRFAALYGIGGTEELLERSAGLLAEALGSASAPQRVERKSWEAALSTAPGLYFDLLGEVPLEVLQEWLSGGRSSQPLSGTVRRLCLTVEQGGGVLLYYINETDGLYYACRTDVLKQGQLASAVSGYVPNGAVFAFEQEGYTALNENTLLPGGTPNMPVYTAKNPLASEDSGVAGELLEALDFAQQSNASYVMSDGVVYRSGADTLRLNTSGEVLYQSGSAAAPRFPVAAGGDGTEWDMVRAAGDVLRDVLLPYVGEGQLFLRSVERTETGGTVEFGCALSGAEVVLSGGAPMARFTIEDGQIEAFTLWMRTYAAGGETAPVLPLRQAMAAAEARGAKGKELRLIYRDSFAEAMTASWGAA